MEKIQNLKHSKETYLYILSRSLERFAFYGIRSILILYMISEAVNISKEDAILRSGYYTSGLVLAPLIGAIFGDLLTGSRRGAILGLIFQAMGAFILCIPNPQTINVALIFIALGSGFYFPNHTALFGKLYSQKTKLLDSAHTFLHFAINLGTFIGVLLISLVAEVLGYPIGFSIAGFILILAVIPLIIPSKKKIEVDTDDATEEATIAEIKPPYSIKNKVVPIILTLLALQLFVYFNDQASIFINQLIIDVNPQIFSSLSYFQQTISPLLFTLFAFAFFFIWYKFYINPFIKLIVGVSLFILASLLMIISRSGSADLHLLLFWVIIVLTTVADLFISPIAYGIITKYSNPKYLAIMISIMSLPGLLIKILFARIIYYGMLDHQAISLMGILVMFALVGGILLYICKRKKALVI